MTRRVYRGGSRPQPLAERFWDKVAVGAPEECWEWNAALSPTGYGLLRLDGGKTSRSHRAAWMLAKGPISSAEHVLHKCDNRRCCNPAHLFLGTHQDNMADRQAKGRAWRPQGTKHYATRLTDERVLEFRARRRAGEPTKVIAAKEGIPLGTMSKIVNRATWRHLP